MCRSKSQEIFNAMGAMYTSISFMGAQSAAAVRPVVSAERIVFYREKAAGMYSALPYAISQVCHFLQFWFYDFSKRLLADLSPLALTISSLLGCN